MDVAPGPKGYVCVTSVVRDEGTDHDYRFTYMMEPEKTPFNITPHIASLKDTDFESLAKDVEAHADTYRYKTAIGDQHPAHILAPRLRSLLTALEMYKMKLDVTRKQMKPLHLSRELSSQGGSQESLLFETPNTGTSGNKKRKPSASQTPKTPATPRNLRAIQTRKSLLADEGQPSH